MSTAEPPEPDPLSQLATLEDPLRRRLYDFVSEHDEPVSREQAAGGVGIGRTLAAYHLDKLAGAGLLSTVYRRPPGRGGPGAGRPAKLYARAEQEFSLSVPPRDYELLARLLVDAMRHDSSGAVRAAVNRAARVAGQAAGRDGGDLLTALGRCGYRPRVAADGDIELRNCPFHRLARDNQETVCGLNLCLLQGLIAGTPQAQVRADPIADPAPEHCCVVVRHAPSTEQGAPRPARRRRTSRPRP